MYMYDKESLKELEKNTLLLHQRIHLRKRQLETLKEAAPEIYALFYRAAIKDIFDTKGDLDVFRSYR